MSDRLTCGRRLTAEMKRQILARLGSETNNRKIAREVGCAHGTVAYYRKHPNPPGPVDGCGRSDTGQRSPGLSPVKAPSPSPGRIYSHGITLNKWGKSGQVRMVHTPPAKDCQYPLTEKRPHKFCGAAVHLRSYCAEHYSACYVKPKPLKLVPAKSKEPGLSKW